jgi:hypothetical protein
MTIGLTASIGLSIVSLVSAYIAIRKAKAVQATLDQVFAGHEYSNDDLATFLRKNLKEISSYKKYVETLDRKINRLEQYDEQKLYKVGLVRFNPFKDTGGDQSFVLTVMNEADTGVMITAIHSREGTRMYAKNIDKTISLKQLSDEEKQSFAKAKKTVRAKV